MDMADITLSVNAITVNGFQTRVYNELPFHQVWQMYLYRKNISVFETMENELYTSFEGIKWNNNFMTN